MKTFRINLGTRKAIHGEKEDYSHKLRSKIARHAYILKDLLKIEQAEGEDTWLLVDNEQSEEFRRAMIPYYLLE